jgi:CBS domain-containing protein
MNAVSRRGTSVAHLGLVLTIATERIVRVSDLMSSPVRTLRVDARIAEAKLVLAAERVSALVVVSERGKIVGVVSSTDLADPRHDDPEASVETAMTRVLFAVLPTDPATAAVHLMVREGIHRVLVVSDTGGLLGIVTSMDVLRVVAERSGEPGTELVRLGH